MSSSPAAEHTTLLENAERPHSRSARSITTGHVASITAPNPVSNGDSIHQDQELRPPKRRKKKCPKRQRQRHPRWQKQQHTTTEPRWRDPNAVLTLREWAELTSLSLPTAKEILSSGNGPPVVKVSPRRIGIRYGDHCAWLDAKVRGRA
jgi:predicted DNA-binding transcriptional regulator AlpA